ncbi:hypothetical protein SJDPG12_09740 [Porphyromonas gingivalis SJD12]|uniref:hypothetical protein n=1 Tax=Porphyromonas gingivalis TaxID=837 RepID=UPI000B511F8D|nr:hypothetical protein [Porphyromonas gingivalis]MCE8179103.1 hypothetical protein [Porphyromonas gingivalis]MDP0531444.1 hypothetical protein [Porphyromonas gingivalis]MDP0625083.1 hypothetical protein [Porphyromonas gingivalis]OWR83234.1 hypothetical protein SJDPG12_09740 [Porphyromonas gingivalis SJD12]WKD53057.1 hypothetical protein NF669_01780 [Porphyromonas gingivalis]
MPFELSFQKSHGSPAAGHKDKPIAPLFYDRQVGQTALIGQVFFLIRGLDSRGKEDHFEQFLTWFVKQNPYLL